MKIILLLITSLFVFGCGNEGERKNKRTELYNSLVEKSIKEIEQIEKDSFEVCQQLIKIGDKSIKGYVTYDRILSYRGYDLERYHVLMKVNGVYENVSKGKINFMLNSNLKQPFIKLIFTKPELKSKDEPIDDGELKVLSLRAPTNYKDANMIIFCSNKETDFEILYLPAYERGIKKTDDE